MKFIVKRASEWNDVVKPCEEAVLEKFMFTDVRNVSDPSELEGVEGTKWFTENNYFNHRKTEHGTIERDFYRNYYVVEINSLEELMKFYDKYGAIIIEESYYCCEGYKTLIIYDDYIE